MKKLYTHSPAADVLECLLNAHRDACPDENFCAIYDDDNNRYIDVTDVEQVIKQLREVDA